MSYIDEIFAKTNVQVLREFLLYGNAGTEHTAESYEKRMNAAYDKLLCVVKKYDSAGEDSELYTTMVALLTEHENVYMEIGIQAGFLLAKDINK